MSSGQVNTAYDYGKGGRGDAYPPPHAGGSYPMQPAGGPYPSAPAGNQYPAGPQGPYYAQQGQTTVVVQQAPTRPESYLILSCLVYWCCNCIFGTIGFGLSMASSSAADENDMEKARQLGRSAMWVNVAGIICSVITGIILVIVYFTLGFTAYNYSTTYY